jgi:hypothetical protein
MEGHFLNHFLLSRAVRVAGEGVADLVGTPHELHITEAAGAVGIEVEGLRFFLLGFRLGRRFR